MITPIARTRVWYDGTAYDVSTIDRESSAIEAYGMVYAETLVFEVKPNGTSGRILYQSDSAQGSIADHQQIVQNIRDSGPYWDATDPTEHDTEKAA